MNEHTQTGRTQRMLMAAANAAKLNPRQKMIVVFANQMQADHHAERQKHHRPKNLTYMGVTRTIIGRINWGHQSVTIEGCSYPAFFDHDVVEDMLVQVKSLEGQWNSQPGDYGYKEPTDVSN